jgi:hypothetical protein
MSDILSAGFTKAKYNPDSSLPIMYGMYLPGIIVCFGIAYNDDKVSAPCYRLSDDPRVGFQTARWVESE